MKKVVTIVGVVLTALALAGVAWAATAEGKLTGELKWNTPGERPFEGVGTNGIHDISTTQPGGSAILDGQTDPLFINKNNDRSGNCTGDEGDVVVQYVDANVGSATYPIICAHFSNYAPPKLGQMSFSFFDTHYNAYLIVSVVYKGANADPIVRFGTTTIAANALSWVNIGADSSGNKPPPMSVANSTKKGDVIITQSQA